MFSYFKSRKLALLLGVMLVLTAVASSASIQHHPFSEIFPPDINLDFGGKDIENVSKIEASNVSPRNSDIIFEDAGEVPTLRWDESAGEWRFNGVILNMNGNNINDISTLNSGGVTLNTGGDIVGASSIIATASLESDSGTVTTSGTGMCIGDQC